MLDAKKMVTEIHFINDTFLDFYRSPDELNQNRIQWIKKVFIH
jgi:hypothetical protein